MQNHSKPKVDRHSTLSLMIACLS